MELADIQSQFRVALDQAQALRESGHRIPCLFITGRAGSGKTYVLQKLRDNTRRNLAFLAYTGIAAINLGGVTINSFFRFPLGPLDPDDIRPARDASLYQKLDGLVIDEVSMVRVDMFDSIDRFLRLNGPQPRLPFGGIPIILVGDLLQLSPVVEHDEEVASFLGNRWPGYYFFDSEAFRNGCDFKTFELTTNHRQRDDLEFLDVLNRVRYGETTADDLELLNSRSNPRLNVLSLEDTIMLTTTRRAADEINRYRLHMLEGREKMFYGAFEGQFNRRDNLPAPIQLRLKVGSQVMFVKNDQNGRWFNGSLGKVIRIAENSVHVQLQSAPQNTYEVTPMKWSHYRYKFNRDTHRLEREEIGTFTQLPLMLAWAITINKSQGLTLEKMAINMGDGAFATGQTYTALSRCRTLNSLTLLRPLLSSDILADERAKGFYAQHLGGTQANTQQKPSP